MIRTFLLRGAWLMLGAAIGTAAGLVTGGAASALPPNGEVHWSALPIAVAGVVIVAAVVGLLPGVREIEVTAARTLLGVDASRIPDVPPSGLTARQRWRTAAWTVLHAVTGLISGFCVFGMLPGGILSLFWVATGRTEELTQLGFTWGTWQVVLLALAMILVAVGGILGTGAAAARLAPVLLGPSAADRLALAEARLVAERRHTVLARELHDGIGHALSIISIQAAAARRVATTRPERAGAALHVIEQTSREAQAELDHLLGLLRDPEATARRATRDDLPTLVERHRRSGLTIEVTDDHDTVPQLVWSGVLDILAEALANAHRHAGDQPVTVTITQSDEEVLLQVSNPRPARRGARRRSGGRGILGMRERAALLDGTVTAGPSHGRWQVAAAIPVPSEVAVLRRKRP